MVEAFTSKCSSIINWTWAILSREMYV